MIGPVLLFQSAQAALSPKDFQARCAGFSQAKDWKGLEGASRAQLAAAPGDAAACSALAYALFAQNRNDEGRAACFDALKIDPNRLDALFYLGLEAARQADPASLRSIAKRIGSVNPEAAVRFWKVPSVQEAIIPGPQIPLVDGDKVQFKTKSLQPLVEIAGFSSGPIILAMTIDPAGVPVRSEVLMGPPGLAKAAVERVAKEWRTVPLQVDGKSSGARFVTVVRIDVTTSTRSEVGATH